LRHTSPKPASGRPLRVGFVLQPAFTLVAFSSFVDALRLAADEGDRSRPLRCQWDVLAPDLTPVRASCAVDVTPTRRVDEAGDYDFVVVVGGLIAAGRRIDARLVAFLRACAKQQVPLVGVCTGSFVLARAGLLDGYRGCVSWFHYREFTREFPNHQVTSSPLFVTDRDRITCAGGTSVTHLAAHLIEQHVGKPESRKALRILIEKAPLPSATPQPAGTESARNVWVQRALLLLERNVAGRLSVREMAAELRIGVRQLERVFRVELGMSPAAYARRLRLQHAHQLLIESQRAVGDVASEAGFADAAHFTRRYRSAYGTTPTQARKAQR
jgi:transcriptional regulator GlxA family with amidase domain